MKTPIAVLLISCWAMDARPAAAAEPARKLGTVKVKQLDEISGIAASRQNPFVFWLHNDGDDGRLFAVRANGKSAGSIELPAKVVDVEDIAIGPGPTDGIDYIYLGDIGDNNASRREIKVLRFAEPKLSGKREISIDQMAKIRLVYPATPQDAEALLVDPLTRELYVITKERTRARFYRASADELQDGAVIVLKLAGTLPVGDVSSAAISPDGRRIIVRQENAGWLWGRDPNESLTAAFSTDRMSIPVLGAGQGPNGEAVTFSPDGSRYFTISEGKKQPIYGFPVPSGQ
jgi:hypothetical protein